MRGPSTSTYSGGRFFPLDPHPAEVFVEDIAAALAKICRYGGMTTEFYSVAEHSVLVSEHVPAEYAFEALLHDAGEAYVGDMRRPLKNAPELVAFREIEQRIVDAVFERFGVLSTIDSRVAIHDIDMRICTDEMIALMRAPVDHGPAVGAKIVALSPRGAEILFMTRFLELTAGAPFARLWKG